MFSITESNAFAAARFRKRFPRIACLERTSGPDESEQCLATERLVRVVETTISIVREMQVSIGRKQNEDHAWTSGEGGLDRTTPHQ
jgi:hypothetical protein